MTARVNNYMRLDIACAQCGEGDVWADVDANFTLRERYTAYCRSCRKETHHVRPKTPAEQAALRDQLALDIYRYLVPRGFVELPSGADVETYFKEAKRLAYLAAAVFYSEK